ncbi:MAG: cystathionine beta-synthase [Patiriisocius sp.]
MDKNKLHHYIKHVLKNMPDGWLTTTTHRLDTYNEALAKTEFIESLETLYAKNNFTHKALERLPTAYDYIRLGHPLSCILEWVISKTLSLSSNYIISFSSQTAPILAILRQNALQNTHTQLIYNTQQPNESHLETLKQVYGYTFDVTAAQTLQEAENFKGSSILITQNDDLATLTVPNGIDFIVSTIPGLGSVLIVNGDNNKPYISQIQHFRRRETIAMTPVNCLMALQRYLHIDSKPITGNLEKNKVSVQNSINNITGTSTTPLVGSSGLSIQFAIMMGLIDHAKEHHPQKAIKIVVPPNCYGGTNDQARRVAASVHSVEVVDLPVDGNNDMVQSIETVLEQIAQQDAIPYIIAEIPTNPRVEVPDLEALKNVLSSKRYTSDGNIAIEPVFILDQTFCPNVHFIEDGAILASVKAIAYASGSKFPSAGQCTAGYCVVNKKASILLKKIALHLSICDNQATALQYEILAKELPSMTQRINDAYLNTREFVTFIEKVMPKAKINFVSEKLANQGFTPSVFSLDLPSKGNTPQERETHKRALNHLLIKMMITKIPNQSKYCVSYGQLKGVYWTIPATSTQGTTKEVDKDYIARVSLSADMDLKKHKEVFLEFIKSM